MASKATSATPATKTPKDILWADVTFKDVKGSDLQGQFPLVLAPGVYKNPDLTEALNQSTDWYKDWLIEAGFTLKGDHGETLLNRVKDLITMTSLLIPDVNPTNPKMQVLTYFLALAELKDDLPEFKDTLTQHKERALQIGMIGGEIIQGKFKSLDDIPEGMKEVKPVFQALLLASAAAREKIPDFLHNCKPFCKSTDESMIGMAFAALDCVMDPEERLPEDSFIYLHRFESGTETFLELATLVVGITLPDAIRQNILFRHVMELGSLILALVKDVFKIRPDVEKEYGLSLINVKARRMPLKQAFKETIDLITEQVINFRAGTQRLRYLYPKNKRLDKFLSVLESLIDGNIYYAARNTKYGDVQVKIITKKEKIEE